MPTDVSWYLVDSEASLDRACQALAEQRVIGVDTEFMRETTFHPLPALIQLGNGEAAYLIDPTLVAPTPALRHLLGETGPLKVFHACGEDLDIFKRWFEDVPSPIADTQLAHALLGGEVSISYQRLVDEWMQTHLPKDETRSNWLLRPLSEKQCRYAALDVAWLPAIWEKQAAELDRAGRLAWLERDCQALVAGARSERDDERWYLRHRNAWRLAPRQLAAFRLLCSWREGAVREQDTPRSWLASDALLMEVAAAMPQSRYDLSRIEGVRPSLIKREGDTLLSLVQKALALDEDQLPDALPSPVSGDYKQRMKVLKQAVRVRAEALSLPPELLATRRELERWISADMNAADWPLLAGWRGEVLNSDLIAALEGSGGAR